jgi:CRISPR-associated protein Cas2
MITEVRFSEYRVMWIIVCFDLPVLTPEERKIAVRFRNDLLKSGFVRLQFSLYVRVCSSRESADYHISGIEKLLPLKGKIDILMITDKQYGSMKSFFGRRESPKPPGFVQLELF